MKRTSTLFSLLAASVILLSSCNGSSSLDPEYNVYFFTVNNAPIKADTYFDVEVGSLLDRPEDPTRPGFDFSGWFTDYARTIEWDFDVDTMPERSLVLYARFDANFKNIVYNLNGGVMTTSNYPIVFIPGQTFVLPRARKTGYLFRGWFLYDQILENFPNNEGTKPGDVGISALPSSAFEDFVVYAHWTVIKVVVTFRANHPLGNSVISNPSSRTIAYGTVIEYGVNFPADLGEVSGYFFTGWNSRADGTGDNYLDGEIFIRTLAITLHGQWQPVV
jgi:uncharacterized repeat protein (TIGR02543 family)